MVFIAATTAYELVAKALDNFRSIAYVATDRKEPRSGVSTDRKEPSSGVSSDV